MDIDDQHTKYPLQPTNTLAGPSSLPDAPPLYLPPPGPPPSTHYFNSTQDLLARFHLLSAYEKYVRPYVTPVAGMQPPSGPSATDKGKGKEKERPPPAMAAPPPSTSHAPGNDGEEEDGKEKKSKNTYRHLIKEIPGKHSMKKDDYLATMMQVPPKQKIAIVPLDMRTQREAFSVGLDGLKGWNMTALVAESPQAREDRKKRKELKRLAKAGQISMLSTLARSGTPSGLSATPATTGAPTSAATTTGTGTPKIGASATSRPPSGNHAQSAQPRGRTPVGIGTPQSLPTPGPGPHVAAQTPAVAPPFVRHSPTTTPAPVAAIASGGAEPKRGQKREREYSTDGQVNGNAPAQVQVYAQTGNTTPKLPITTGAKAGNGGIRPRPLKKQRVDTAGQAREMPVQQPTPHA